MKKCLSLLYVLFPLLLTISTLINMRLNKFYLYPLRSWKYEYFLFFSLFSRHYNNKLLCLLKTLELNLLWKVLIIFFILQFLLFICPWKTLENILYHSLIEINKRVQFRLYLFCTAFHLKFLMKRNNRSFSWLLINYCKFSCCHVYRHFLFQNCLFQYIEIQLFLLFLIVKFIWVALVSKN